MHNNIDDLNFGELILSLQQMIEASYLGNLLSLKPNNKELESAKFELHKALVDYLNNSSSNNDAGDAAEMKLLQYVKNREQIYNGNYNIAD